MIFKLQFSFPMQPDIQASSDFGLSFLRKLSLPRTALSHTHPPLKLFLLLTPAVTPTGIGAVGWGLMILSPSTWLLQVHSLCCRYLYMLFLESYEGSKEERADNGAKARCKLSSRPAIASHSQFCTPFRSSSVLSLWRCILRYDPSPNCAYSAIKLASFFPAVQESKNCSP